MYALGIILSIISPAVAQVPPLSQNTNYYISKTSDNHLYISSMDGLNVYDGHHVKVYKPSAECGMYGSNIQSYFFEDDRGRVWFSTYEALHYHDVYTDSIHHFFLPQDDGAEAREDYRCIALLGDDLIVKADRTLYVYNTARNAVTWSDTLGLKDGFMERLWQTGDTYTLTSSTNRLPVTKVIEFSQSWEVLRDTILPVVSTCTFLHEDRLYVGTAFGELQIYEWPSLDMVDVYSIASRGIQGIARGPDGALLMLCGDGASVGITRQGRLYDLDLSISPLYENRSLDPPFVDNDQILWYGVEGVGVQSFDLKVNFFDQYRLKDVFYSNAIIPFDDKFIVTSRVAGLLILDSDFEILHYERSLLGEDKGFGSYFMGRDGNQAFIRVGEMVYAISMDDFTMVKRPDLDYNMLQRADTQHGSYIVMRDRYDLLHLPRGSTGSDTTVLVENDILCNSIKVLNDSIVFLGLNDASTGIYHLIRPDSAVLMKSLDIAGNIKCVTQASDSTILYCTNRGVYVLNAGYDLIGKLEDKNGQLNGTVYALLIDDHGKYWCSTNNGIIKYDPEDSTAYRFDLSDGLQGLEYNTDSYLHLDDGRMIFGGVNGLNIFHPDSIRLSDYQTKVTISEFELMDEPSIAFGRPNHIERIALPFDQNYFDFTFVGTDFSALSKVRLRYKLEGFDHQWQYASNPHTAEYKKVPPGKYRLRVNASNADGIWSIHERVIPIRIYPPWWETWWFRILAALGIGAVIYGAISYYLRQELRAKNLLLKAKQLELDKVEALTAERNRIASEMHDDLGGGLSSIRYLSQGLLKKIDDDTTRVQMSKIFQYSQDLISNMSEIIWAMNNRFDISDNFIAYTRRYAHEFLHDFDIQVDFTTSDDVQGVHMPGEHRRNLFLIIKETLHNTVKHAEASKVRIRVSRETDILVLNIQDDGRGYDQNLHHAGAGLGNMKRRADAAGANITVNSHRGTTTTIVYKILEK